jgi:hypothetical protein
MKSIWKDVFKFLSGAFFVTAGASWYLSWFHIAVPLPFSFSAQSFNQEEVRHYQNEMESAIQAGKGQSCYDKTME